MPDIPITFTENCFALFDPQKNAVLTTNIGNLAIYNTKGIAESMARTSARNIIVIPVTIERVLG